MVEDVKRWKGIGGTGQSASAVLVRINGLVVIVGLEEPQSFLSNGWICGFRVKCFLHKMRGRLNESKPFKRENEIIPDCFDPNTF